MNIKFKAICKSLVVLLILSLFIVPVVPSYGGEPSAEESVKFKFVYDSIEYNIDEPLVSGVYDYSIDIPFSTTSTSWASITIESSPSAIITKMNLQGGYSYGENAASFTSQFGEIDLIIDIGGTNYTFRLFEQKFNGLVIEPDTVVGDWGNNYISFTDENPNPVVQVLLGTKSVKLKLPDSTNNKMKSISMSTSSAISYYEVGDYYIIEIDDSISYTTYYSLQDLTSGSSVLKEFQIDLMAVTSQSRFEVDDEHFENVVTYTPHPNFEISDPRLLVNYSNASWVEIDGESWIEFSGLYFSVFDLTVNNLNPIETNVFSGNSLDVALDTPNSISVFLINGDIAIDAETFGGVAYGKGQGWNELFPNFSGR